MHKDYRTLESKVETIHSTKPISQYQNKELKERGQIASPYHFSNEKRFNGDDHVNPLKEFTFSDKGTAQRAMYNTDAFAQQKHQSVTQELRDESKQLIESIRRNYEESRKALDHYKSEPDLNNQF